MATALAGSMELAVIAEGGEAQAQRDSLTGLGCHDYKGYLFSKPVSAVECEALVHGRLI